MESYRIAIGILAFARPDDLLATLESVARLTTPNVTTFVLQNGMPAGDFQRVAAAHPQINALTNSQNLGAAGGRNYLIQLALAGGFDFLCFLDSDALLAPDALDQLLAAYPRLDRPGLVSCLVRATEHPTNIHSSGVTLDRASLRDIHHRDIPEQPIVERDAVITTAALIACDVLQAGPRLDERIFAYWEDIDWCLQFGQADYHHYVVRDATAFHAEARSRFHPAVIYYMTRNHLLVAGKLGYSLRSSAVAELMRGNIFHLFKRIKTLTPLSLNCLAACLQAYLHALTGCWGIAPKWTQRPDEQFLEMWFYRSILQRRLVPIVRTFRRRTARLSR